MNAIVRGYRFSLASGSNRRACVAAAIVVALHAVLIAIVLTKRDAATASPPELHTITAELLRPEPLAAQVSIPSTPTRPTSPAPQATREKPKKQPAPTPLPAAQAPSPHPVETPVSTEAAPSAPSAPGPGPSAPEPAQGKPAIAAAATSAPKNVSHLDCRIVQPDYPMQSKRRGETGTAYVRFVVDVSGRIESIELKQSSGYSRLDDAALAALRDSSCKPYLENGEPVRAAYIKPFDFNLRD